MYINVNVYSIVNIMILCDDSLSSSKEMNSPGVRRGVDIRALAAWWATIPHHEKCYWMVIVHGTSWNLTVIQWDLMVIQ